MRPQLILIPSLSLSLSCPVGYMLAFLYLEPYSRNPSWRAQVDGLEKKKERQNERIVSEDAWENSTQMRHWMKGNEDIVREKHIIANQGRVQRETKRKKKDCRKNRGRVEGKAQSSMLRKTNEPERQWGQKEREEKRREVRGRRDSWVVSLTLFNRD